MFTGWFYYISLDYCKAFTDTLPIVCNGFKMMCYFIDSNHSLICQKISPFSGLRARRLRPTRRHF